MAFHGNTAKPNQASADHEPITRCISPLVPIRADAWLPGAALSSTFYLTLAQPATSP